MPLCESSRSLLQEIGKTWFPFSLLEISLVDWNETYMEDIWEGEEAD